MEIKLLLFFFCLFIWQSKRKSAGSKYRYDHRAPSQVSERGKKINRRINSSCNNNNKSFIFTFTIWGRHSAHIKCQVFLFLRCDFSMFLFHSSSVCVVIAKLEPSNMYTHRSGRKRCHTCTREFVKDTPFSKPYTWGEKKVKFLKHIYFYIKRKREEWTEEKKYETKIWKEK